MSVRMFSPYTVAYPPLGGNNPVRIDLQMENCVHHHRGEDHGGMRGAIDPQ